MNFPLLSVSAACALASLAGLLSPFSAVAETASAGSLDLGSATTAASGTLTWAGTGTSNSTGITKTDGATLVLGGASTYSGATTISYISPLAYASSGTLALGGASYSGYGASLVLNTGTPTSGAFAVSSIPFYSRPTFFNGEDSMGSGVLYLRFDGRGYQNASTNVGIGIYSSSTTSYNYNSGQTFGYYTHLSDPNYIYHFDMGYEYVFDAHDGRNGVYFYDFQEPRLFLHQPELSVPVHVRLQLGIGRLLLPRPETGRTATTRTECAISTCTARAKSFRSNPC